MVQLSHPYVTTGKTIALTTRSFVSEVMSLLFDILSRFVIAFLPRSKCLLISCLQSPSAVILEPKKIKTGLHEANKSFESFHLNLKHASPLIPNCPGTQEKQACMKWEKKVQILSSEREGCLSLVTKLGIKGQTYMILQVDKWLYIILLYMNNCSIYQK